MQGDKIFKKGLFIICLLLPFIVSCKEEQVKAEDLNVIKFAKTQLFVNSNEKEHVFEVEIADTPEKRGQGLMFRRHMNDDAGMIFDFDVTMFIRMWMKNTYIPLDMIFISESKEIIDIIENAAPLSEEILIPNGNAKYVLEINAGVSKRLGISIGDKVKCSIFD